MWKQYLPNLSLSPGICPMIYAENSHLKVEVKVSSRHEWKLSYLLYGNPAKREKRANYDKLMCNGSSLHAVTVARITNFSGQTLNAKH